MLALLVLLSAVPAEERLYIANDDHTDYVWTLDEEGYRQAFQNMITFYLDEAERTQANPDNARGRFNLDGSLWVYEWEKNQPPEQMDRLMNHVAAGDISVQLHSLVLLGGAMPTEAVLRDMMYAGSLERRYGVTIDLAVMMENQTLAGGLASLWAGAGAKYSWRGICDCATRIPGAAQRAREIYRFAGHDGQGVLMKWSSLVSDNRSIGGYAEAFDPDAAVTVMEDNSAYNGAWPYPVKAAFGHGWDAAETETDAFVDTALARTDADHTVIVSNEDDFFRDFESTVDVDHDVPLFVGGHGNEWDLNTASLAAVTGDMRRSIEKLRTAEALAAIVASADPSFLQGRFDGTDEERELAQLHMGMFYDHDWTADSPTLHDAREQFQRDAAAQVKSYVDGLAADGLARLGQLVPAGDGADGSSIYAVANPLALFNTALVELPGVDVPFQAVDVTGGFDVPSQLVVDEDGTTHAFAFVAAPPLGYHLVRVTPLNGAPPAPDLCTVVDEPDGAKTLTDGHVIITVEPDGRLSSFVNLHDDNELAGAGLFTFEVDGAQDAAAGAAVVLEANGPALCRARVDVPSSPPRTIRYTLAGEDRVDVDSVITGGFSGTVGYRVDLSSLPGAVVHHEEVGMLALAKRIADGGDYADEDARTDFLTLNHFVDAGNAVFGFSVASLESGFMRVGDSTVDTLDESPTSLLLVVGMQLDPGLGFADQGGDTRFVNHYALVPRDYGYTGDEELTLSLEDDNPPVAVLASGARDAPLSDSFRILVNVRGMTPWWVKPPEDGVAGDIVARVWNGFDAPTDVTLRGSFSAASRVSHIETELADPPQPVLAGDVTQTLAPDQIATYRLTLAADPVDGGVDVDGGVGLDAGPVDADAGAGEDAGAGVDAGPGVDGPGGAVGCTCRTSSVGALAWPACALVLVRALRRRRRRGARARPSP